MTGFRVAPGGAQELFGVRADLTTLGKIIGGGLPVGAYGGRREIMEMVSPSGPVYQAGTLSGNPLAMAAGYELLSALACQPSIYAKLEKRGAELASGIGDAFRKRGLRYRLNRVGSMFTLFFTEEEVSDLDTARSSDTKLFARWFRGMLSRGIYLPPSQFEAAFLSAAHGERELEQTLRALGAALDTL
jgi:glutamate-1-semialdehyde 2,1-aminomutase